MQDQMISVACILKKLKTGTCTNEFGLNQMNHNYYLCPPLLK